MKKYIVFWLSQSVSQLGSAMTGFALILWAFQQTESAMSVSLMSFCNYVPYIVISLFAGTYVDRHSKKKIMLLADSVAAMGTLVILAAWHFQILEIIWIYAVNAVIGAMNAFQSPASTVAVARLVPEEKLGQVSGMNSFSGNMIAVFSPVLASALFAFGGLKVILAVDFCTFLFAFAILFFFIKIPELETQARSQESAFAGCKTGFSFLFDNKGLWYIVITMAVLNFLSRLTYENILSPMLLARSGKQSMVFGCVNAAMGIGGILGGILVSTGRLSKDKIKMIYASAAFSFFFGDLLMGVGRNVWIWCIAGVAASLPIPFVMAGQNVILYQKIPKDMQGRVFAVRNAIQFGTIPIGILLGGFLGEYIFEPFMQTKNGLVDFLHLVVGSGEGSGMAVMFLCTGLCGGLFSFWVGRRKEMDELR